MSVGIPDEYGLSPGCINPFNPTASSQWLVRSEQSPLHANLKIFNILGQEVRTMVDEAQKAGNCTVTWYGRDRSGHDASSGLSFYRLKVGSFVQTRRMVLLK